MTFAEHLEELRWRLLKSLVALVLCAGGCLLFQEELVRLYAHPYDAARQRIHERRLEEAREQAAAPAEGLPSTVLSLAEIVEEHFPGELAKRGIDPEALRRELGIVGAPVDIGPLRTMAPSEAFITTIKAVLLTAAILAAPVFLYQMWQFVVAGLYAHERKTALRVLPGSLFLFAVGLAFGFLVLVPVGLDFLLDYGDPQVMRSEITTSSYLSFLCVMLLVMGLVFQVPLLMVCLATLGLAGPATFRKHRKVCIVAGAVCAALLTPPDVVSQMLVLIPMLLLYELGVFLSVIAVRRKGETVAASAGRS